jgi:metal-sulfur cluster biosynthetic enzyme
MELDRSISAKFDAILASVKEPQSELSLADLGLVSKLTYYAADKTIVAHMNFAAPGGAECPACSLINDMMKSSIERDLKSAILAEFPGWTVDFA